jgi:hypothetical protein
MRRIGLLVCAVLTLVALALDAANAGSTAPSVGATTLPDGRVYEQVSSQKKNGNEAGVTVVGIATTLGGYGTASPAGDVLAYTQVGPSGETSSGVVNFAVSSRKAQAGWEASVPLPPAAFPNGDFNGLKPLTFLPSVDRTHFLFTAAGRYVKENAKNPAEGGDFNGGLYRTRNNSEEPEWLSRPTFEEFSQAKPEPGTFEKGFYPAGGSPDLSRVYFTYFGTLVPEDEPRRPLVEPLPWSNTRVYNEHVFVEEAGKHYESIKEENENHKPSETLGVWWEEVAASAGVENLGPWGFYEWHAGGAHGELRSAGELPDHSYSPYGAVPAVTQNALTFLSTPSARYFQNQVSQDGSKAFFDSPERLRASEAGEPSELYVREQTPSGPTTVLVSRDEGGKPAPAPCTKGASFEACAETAVTAVRAQWAQDAYLYASPDGSRAFFESKDKLTSAVPAGTGPWTYEFNVAEDKVTYLPGVVGVIAASSQDGSSFIFKNTETHKIELWSGGSAGHAEEIASYSTPVEPEFEGSAAKSGETFVFNTNAVLAHTPAFNNASGLLQAYRYDASSKRLSCVSCAPEGVPQHAVDLGDAENRGQGREIADEGRRVFFGTAAQLVPAAENGVEYVYEWEQKGTGSCSSEEQEGGCVDLVSSGASHDPSFYLDNDESGENVFFATRAGLAKGDTDESYDVYDARVGGGFPEQSPPKPCEATCRTAAEAPVLPGPLTDSLGPVENTTRTTVESSGVLPTSSSKPTTKPLTRAQELSKALKACAKKPKRQRAACVKRAKRLYGSKPKKKHR